jgi:single-strand DNA-binding protein
MINKVILVGHLGKDPEVKYLDKDRAVANFSIATNDRYTDKNGNRVDTTEWHNIEMWDGLAKVAEKYLKKGSLIYVEGKLKTDEWEKDGIKRYTTRIRVNTMNMLDKAAGEVNQNSATISSEPAAAVKQIEEQNEAAIHSIIDNAEDDLPF